LQRRNLLKLFHAEKAVAGSVLEEHQRDGHVFLK
jgi:hypothetical protein